MRHLALRSILLIAVAVPFPLIAQTALVTTTADSGAGSLRDAITTVNAASCASGCAIVFQIPPPVPAGGYFTIQPASELPRILASNLVIDGATQTAATGDTNPAGPEIEINGSLAGNAFGGLVVGAYQAGAGQRVTIKNMAINGFAGGGIVLDGIAPNMASDNIITGNYIGTNASGTAAVGNGQGIGIGSNAMNNLIGGMSAAERNVISGNTSGMVIAQNATANRIIGNYIGTDVSGTKAIGNTSAGIYLGALGNGNTISGNVIGGNLFGITFYDSSENQITGNKIGIGALGAPLPNTDSGIYISGPNPSNNIIGGTFAGAANEIAFNARGIRDDSGNGNQFIRNAIYKNTTIGIDLGNDGVTPDDATDADTGPNGLQNFPLIQSAKPTLSGIAVTFSVDSSSVASTHTIGVEVFKADSSSVRQGKLYLGSQCYGGNTISNQTLFLTTNSVAAGDQIVMTATSYSDQTCGTVNEGTSEFSPPADVRCELFVTNTNDAGAGSLREAILFSNVSSGCTIVFNIPAPVPASGWFTIQPLSPLWDILSSGTVIDGNTQTAFTGDTNPDGPEIELDGTNQAIGDGLVINPSAGGGQNVKIRNLCINRFFGPGIGVGGSINFVASGNRVEQNYIGTDCRGLLARPNNIGVYLIGSNNGIVGNLISGNQKSFISPGIRIGAGSANNVIANNFIGTDRTGAVSIFNPTGILIEDSSTTTIAGNLIAFGTALGGIYITGGLGGHQIVQNTIRFNQLGVVINSAAGGNHIASNTIEHNTGQGIRLIGAQSGNVIENNLVRDNGAHPIWIDSSVGRDSITGNTIQNHPLPAVVLLGTQRGTTILGNFMMGNMSGIDLGNNGFTPNDPGDSDSGTNGFQNNPVISQAHLINGDLNLKFSVDSSAVTTTRSLRVEFFISDPSGEGRVPLGTQCYAGNQLNQASMIIPNAPVNQGDLVVATATSYNDTTCGLPNDGTSEFSLPASVRTNIVAVTNTNDAGPGSLRTAIATANTGVCVSPCRILFRIPAPVPPAGYFTITPHTNLTNLIASGTILDGATQTAFTGDTNPLGPEIDIDGSLIKPIGTGFLLGAAAAGQGSQIEVRNLCVHSFNGAAFGVGANMGTLASGNIIANNYIGTDATGQFSRPNGAGVYLADRAVGTQIMQNVISANTFAGVQIAGFLAPVDGTILMGNRIGTGASGHPLPNGRGITINGGYNSIIGPGNIIANNALNGIEIFIGTGNRIFANSIDSNGGLGIDLVSATPGVTPNDPLDADSGANNLQNYPVLLTKFFNPLTNTTTITGTLNSKVLHGYRVDLYGSDVADPSGFGEGQRYLGSINVNTNLIGTASFTITVQGQHNAISSTATDLATNDTSEFSKSI
ncbi:MAG: hypothetical protein DMF57_10970 [Acidobacteria bacterium]|nr:MAG: hypothetical protein DMF57_10970 [Acidobacteriota bacterium]